MKKLLLILMLVGLSAYGQTVITNPSAGGGVTGVDDPTDPTGTTATLDFGAGRYHTLDTSSATGTVVLTISNAVDGDIHVIEVTTGATERDLTFPAGTTQGLEGGATWSPSAPYAVDLITLVYNGSVYRIIGTNPLHEDQTP